MELTEHVRSLRSNSGPRSSPTNNQPYIGVATATISIPHITVTWIGLTLNSGVCLAYSPDKEKWFITFSEPKMENHYNVYKLATKNLSLGSSCNGSQADTTEEANLLSPMKDGLAPGRYFLEEPIEEKDQLWYGLIPAK